MRSFSLYLIALVSCVQCGQRMYIGPKREKVNLTSTYVRTTTVQSLPYALMKHGNIKSIKQLIELKKDDAKLGNVGPVARVTNNFNIASLPCCRDRFGENACQSLRKSHPSLFEKRCLSDHDFHSIDCCSECRKYIAKNNISVDNAKTLFKAPQTCRDKHSVAFCRRFKASGLGKFSCADAEFAVRVCRHSCGYCNDDLYAADHSPPMCASATELRRLRSRLYN